jgi:23S rRNA pseudouridine2605 synthase
VEERVQKILARAGYGSRRACEQIIAKGRITVNGKLIQLGDKADPQNDEIRIDGQLVQSPERIVYIALHKPRGVLSTTDTAEDRKTLLDLVPVDVRLFMVGRLDLESEGLVLLTNDGNLANRLMHPRYEHEKEYRVLVARHPDSEQLNLWRNGVTLEDGYKTAPAKVFLDKYKGLAQSGDARRPQASDPRGRRPHRPASGKSGAHPHRLLKIGQPAQRRLALPDRSRSRHVKRGNAQTAAQEKRPKEKHL